MAPQVGGARPGRCPAAAGERARGTDTLEGTAASDSAPLNEDSQCASLPWPALAFTWH